VILCVVFCCWVGVEKLFYVCVCDGCCCLFFRFCLIVGVVCEGGVGVWRFVVFEWGVYVCL